MAYKKHFPIYMHFIENLMQGFSSLDTASGGQMKAFIKSCQHKSGAFTERSGEPDFYYSLFGVWLSIALDLGHVAENYKKYFNNLEGKPAGTIDLMAYELINISLPGRHEKLKTFSIFRKIYQDRKNISLSYRLFLLMLILDAKNRHHTIFRILSRIWLTFYKVSDNTPCSILAALVFIKRRVGVNYEKELKKLLACFTKGKAFSSFSHDENADMLSTAVALFVLKYIGYDMRYIAPDCLQFIEQNYDSGAFLSGDGDKTRDLEYTFYGLLALGALV